jgi:hypothetical protein
MNSAVKEIKKIFDKNGFGIAIELPIHIEQEKQLDRDLEQFLDRWEEGLIEANREAIEEQAIENYEPDCPYNEGYA